MSKTHKVIDVNCFGREELVSYLAASKDNIAIITDYAAIELYKGGSINHLHRKIEMINPYIDQFMMLKNTPVICQMKRLEKKSHRLTSKKQTKEFQVFFDRLSQAKASSSPYAFNGHMMYAQEFEEMVRPRAKKWVGSFPALVSSYTDAELKIIRNDLECPPLLADKILEHIIVTAKEKFGRRLEKNEIPTNLEVAIDMFLFRYSIAAYAWFVITLRRGVEQLNEKQTANDNADLGYISYATYYDDLMTNDSKAYEIYKETLTILDWLRELVFQAKINNQIYMI